MTYGLGKALCRLTRPCGQRWNDGRRWAEADIGNVGDVRAERLGDGAVEIPPGEGLVVADEEGFTVRPGGGQGQLDGVDEIVDIDPIADSKSPFNQVGATRQQVVGETRRPA